MSYETRQTRLAKSRRLNDLHQSKGFDVRRARHQINLLIENFRELSDEGDGSWCDVIRRLVTAAGHLSHKSHRKGKRKLAGPTPKLF